MFFALMYVLCGVLGFAISVMLAFHFWGVLHGETSVEAQDNDAYRRRAADREEAFVNSYDVGKRRNFELFFNIGEGG
jgi:palmitoyltransferase